MMPIAKRFRSEKPLDFCTLVASAGGITNGWYSVGQRLLHA